MDTQPDHIEAAVQAIVELLELGEVEGAIEALLELHPADRAQAFSFLQTDQQAIFIGRLDIPSTADLLEELEDQEALEAVESMPTQRLADVLDEMKPDEAADLLGDLPPDQASEALAQMQDAEDVIPLLAYPDETAGGLMTTSYLALRRHTTAARAIDFLREVSPNEEVPYYLYVLDREKRLIGIVGLRELVVAGPDTDMESIMDPDVIHVETGADQEEAARVMARYDLAALPVVDHEGRMLGVITHDDIVDVLDFEATEDIYRMASVSDTGLQPDSAIGVQLRGRLPWLYLSTLTALLAAWVISFYEALIAQVAALAVFQSVVAGLGGNAVSQNMAMVVRSVALGKVASRQVWRVLAKQLYVGLLQGLAIGVFVGLGVYLWRGNLALSFVLSLALIGNLLVAGLVGTLVPLGLNAAGQDPALASSVLVTSATDSLGFLIFLSLAAYFLPYLI